MPLQRIRRNDMRTTKCDWCGEELGYEHDTRYPEACSEPECQREVRGMYREMQDDAQDRAREDEYSRYI